MIFVSLASATCLMRASIGQILASPEGMDLLLGLIGDCDSIPVQASSLVTIRKMRAEPDSTLTSSMLRDIESNGKVEAEHIVGDMLVGGQLCEKRASNVSVTERTASIRKVWRGYPQACTFRLRLGDA